VKITVLTPTFNRPKCLGRLVRCFQMQDYQDRELVILDDAQQYPPIVGDRWRLEPWPTRFPTLGHKRNALLDLAGRTDAICWWDDDDWFFPHALSACVAALQQSAWVQSSLVYEQEGGRLVRRETFDRRRPDVKGYPGAWAYRRCVLDAVAWPHTSNGEDQLLAEAIRKRFGPAGDTISGAYPEPFMVYSYPTQESRNLSRLGPGNQGYERLGQVQIEPVMLLDTSPDADFAAMPVVDGVQPRRW
jgi:glycosyltransferase involved in cell wall biosynthesis